MSTAKTFRPLCQFFLQRYGDVTVSGDYYVTADNGETIFTSDSTLPELLTFDEDSLSQS